MPLDVTATLGVPGSASTWVFNVVRELQILQHGKKNVESFYSDATERAWQVFKENNHLDKKVVWKIHDPDETWEDFLLDVPVKLVLSIRDPRDAMLSLMERFGETMDPAFNRVFSAFNRIVQCLAHPHVMLRYEDRFFDKAETIAKLARSFNATLTEAEQDRIFTTYQTESVRSFGKGIDALPEGRSRRIGTIHYDEVTQIHDIHIGNQRVGKWRQHFNADERQALNEKFKLFLDIFDYEGE